MPRPEWGSVRGGGARGRSTGGRWRGVDPIIPFTDQEQLASIRDFYGLVSGLKLEQQLISRSQSDERKPKRLYLVSDGAGPLSLLMLCSAASCFAQYGFGCAHHVMLAAPHHCADKSALAGHRAFEQMGSSVYAVTGALSDS